ncbi:MAG: transposase [Deltaproteobacteria bacterium]|nr:transposase [Deltaproteobacteria bacterium]
MPRQKREDYKGAWHHVMNRGARRNRIFFLEIVGEAVFRYRLELHAYSLMPNHYHLLARSLEGNLSRCMRHINGGYTQWLNKKRSWDGPVFRGRFKSQLVQDDEYLRYLLAYIHLNPIEAKLVIRLDSECWTSHRAYLGKESIPPWLNVKTFLHLFSGKTKLHAFVKSVRQRVINYPEDFNPETGLYKEKTIVGSVQRFNQPAQYDSPETTYMMADEVLKEVCRITGASREEILQAQKGPRANPARRFAIWALVRGAGMLHRDVAKILDLPTYQVPKVMSQIQRKGASQPLGEWLKTWEDKYQGS